MNKINLLIPQNKAKNNKSDVRGLWLDNQKIYYDYLKTLKIDVINRRILNNYCKYYNQLAIFYIKGKQAYIYTKQNKSTEILNKRKFWIIQEGHLLRHKAFIKKTLKKYNGLTIYRDKVNHCYILEIWHKSRKNNIKLYHFTDNDNIDIVKTDNLGANYYTIRDVNVCKIPRVYYYLTSKPSEYRFKHSKFMYIAEIDKSSLYNIDIDKLRLKNKFNNVYDILNYIKQNYKGLIYNDVACLFYNLKTIKKIKRI